jgi:hypothetical protein
MIRDENEKDGVLHQFDVKLLDPEQNYSMAFIGARFAGKTKFLEYLYQNWIKDTFDLVIIFCDNPQAEAYDWLPKKQLKFVFPEFHSSVIRDLDIFQNLTKNALKIMVIFDDCSSKRGNKYNDALQQLFIRGRNLNMSIIFSTQSSNFINSDSRGNLDWLFLFKHNSSKKKQNTIEDFMWDVIPIPEEAKKNRSKKLEYYMQVLAETTADHNILIIDYRNGELLYKYKVDITKLKSFKKSKKTDESSDSSDDEHASIDITIQPKEKKRKSIFEDLKKKKIKK